MFWAEFQTKCSSESKEALSKEFQCFTLIRYSHSTDSEGFSSILLLVFFQTDNSRLCTLRAKTRAQQLANQCSATMAVLSVPVQPWALCWAAGGLLPTSSLLPARSFAPQGSSAYLWTPKREAQQVLREALDLVLVQNTTVLKCIWCRSD